MDAFLRGISYYLPEIAVSNEVLVGEFPEWDVDKIMAKVGIRNRYVTSKKEFTSDIATKAGRKLMEEYDISPDTFDMLIVCTQSPDYFLPTTACIVQENLGLPTTVGAFDYNQGCSGYIYGLAMAKGFIASGTAKNILLITAETYSKHIHPLDKGNRSIFGDAASASWISADKGFARIDHCVLGTDGRGAQHLIVRNGGLRNPKNHQTVTNEEELKAAGDYLFMDGPEIFNFTLKAVPELLNRTLEKNNTEIASVDWVIFHQANKFMLDQLRKKMKIPEEKFLLFMENCGNTVSSTIPIVLKEQLAVNKFESNNKVVLCGFGVGFSWGGTVLQF
ncbi:3-oxoacyl-ACP synthase III family protein [Chitinophaga sp. Cy-1792]|uniref:3-oxoacyl-ACP synthase III family protein n=1 Tax=Chitinophaga sp. Cy-1792 TaxID=2608339 RepID=UPI00141ED845|nr:ketoacyl-ACP synthase III [Chitinophaga sp. Cy-1792]NIG52083.1 ketoacyl-ACP synthase III [Chitinophaga sp. Cy-1792]